MSFRILDERDINSIKGKLQGSVVRADDVLPAEHKIGVTVKSKNLIPTVLREETKSGITLTIENDGVIVANGIGTQNTSFSIVMASSKKVPLSKGKTYVLSCISGLTDDKGYVYLQNVAESEANIISVTNGSKSYTATEDGFAYIGIVLLKNKEFVNERMLIQLEEGETATEYTPYVDPASVTLTRCGKNLLDVTKSELMVVGASGVKRYGVIFDNIGIYTFSCNAPIGIAVKVVTDGEYSDFTTLINDVSYTFTLAENQYLILYQGAEGVQFNSDLENAQIEQGETATDYEPYNSTTYTPSEDGSCDIKSISPTMTLITDKEGAIIECEYNKDATAVINKLTNAIIALGGTV